MTTGEIPYAPASYHREYDSDDPSDRIIGYPVYQTEPSALPVPSEQNAARAGAGGTTDVAGLRRQPCSFYEPRDAGLHGGLSRTLIYNHLQGCLDAGSIVAVGFWQAKYHKVTIYAKVGA